MSTALQQVGCVNWKCRRWLLVPDICGASWILLPKSQLHSMDRKSLPLLPQPQAPVLAFVIPGLFSDTKAEFGVLGHLPPLIEKQVTYKNGYGDCSVKL